MFSGGGAKALAHVGAFRALEEAGLAPVHIVGSSMGAVVGAALASGVTWKGVRGAALALSPDEISPLDLLALVTGVFSTNLLRPEFLERLIARLVTPRSFAELRIPLTVTATDLDTGDLALFGAGGREHVPLHEALFASCALPLYYPPITIATRRYADGGLRAVLPLEPARTVPAGPVDLVVAVHVGPGFDEVLPEGAEPDRRIPPLVRAHGEAMRIMMAAQVERDVAAWPAGAPKLVLVRPVRDKEATFKIQEAERYIDAGYQETKERLRG
ncbi:MAG: patatin-like phospholipase family protein [Gemmatimonadales bacterium]